MQKSRWKSFLVAAFAFIQLTFAVHAQDWLQAFGENAHGRTYQFFIDESAGETDIIYFDFWPDIAVRSQVTQVELWTNLNMRDNATLTPPDPATITAGQTTSGATPLYFRAYTMADNGNDGYYVQMPIEKCGVYDVTVRYKISGDANWHWYPGTQAIVNIQDVICRDMIMYELHVNSIDATGDTFATRSTFADLIDNNRFGPDYISNFGANCIWLQPYHTIGAKGDVFPNCNKGSVGSPYSMKNIFEVASYLGSDGTVETALAEFKNFVSVMYDRGIYVVGDTILNHLSNDAEIVRDPDNPSQLYSNPQTLIKNVKPNWFSKYTGTANSCNMNFDSWSSWQYQLPASNSNEIGPAPANRANEFIWEDTFDLFWGLYDGLGDTPGSTSSVSQTPANNPDASTWGNWSLNDTYWNASTEVKKMTEYFTQYFYYWLDVTDNKLAGFRCDFAQGVPQRAWRYIINKAKSRKPELYFVAECLDGRYVAVNSMRAGHNLNENQIWAMLAINMNSASEVRNLIDGNPDAYGAGRNKNLDELRDSDFANINGNVVGGKSMYGYSLILRGTMNHDQGPDVWAGQKWKFMAAHGIYCTIDGTPQLYQGQEMGYDSVTYSGTSCNDEGSIDCPGNPQVSKVRKEFGRIIPDIRSWYNINGLWNNIEQPVADNKVLWDRYADANWGRRRAKVLRNANQWYLNQMSGSVNEGIFSVLKYETFGAAVENQEAVYCFVNMKPGTAVNATFDVNLVNASNESPVIINRTSTYNVRNLASSTPNTRLWGTNGRTGADILDNGLTISFSSNTSTSGSVTQYLILESNDVTAPTTPMAVTAEASGSAVIHVYWGPVDGATSYDIYRAGILVGNSTDTTFSDRTVNASTEYCYTVVAKNSFGSSDPSVSVCATTGAPDPNGFEMNGLSDCTSYEIANSGMNIIAAIRGNSLYVATWTPSPVNGNDHFIFVGDTISASAVNMMPWGKDGLTAFPTDTPFLASEATNDWIGWFNATAFDLYRSQTEGQQMEGTIDLVATFGSIPNTLYMAAVAYQDEDGGVLGSQCPARLPTQPETDYNIDPGEILVVNTAEIKDENANCIFDHLETGATFGITSFEIRGTQATLIWESQFGVNYIIQTSTDLLSWSQLGGTIAGDIGTETSSVFTISGRKRYYRVCQP